MPRHGCDMLWAYPADVAATPRVAATCPTICRKANTMIKKLLATLAMLYCGLACASVDANQASVAELDSIKGIGPAMSSRILDERKKGPFKSWADLMARVKGVGQASAARLSSEGLTVGGATFRIAVPKMDAQPAGTTVKK